MTLTDIVFSVDRHIWPIPDLLKKVSLQRFELVPFSSIVALQLALKLRSVGLRKEWT